MASDPINRVRSRAMMDRWAGRTCSGLLKTPPDVGDTPEGIRSGSGMLQDSLLGLEVPVLGNIGELPGVSDVFEDFEKPVEESLANVEDLTVNKFKSLAVCSFSPG
ncbi:MAG: hypothetical protein U0936_06315 [Planctomycetaceae bacterium]